MPFFKKLAELLASRRFLVVLLISIAILGSLLVFNNSNTPSIEPKVVKSHSPANYQHGITSPISLGKLSDPVNSYINLHLSFYAPNLNGHQNIFQTAPGNEGLRLEISGSTAALVVADSLSTGGVKGLTISSDLNANQWYDLQIVARNGKSISASLNGKQVVDYKSAGLELKGSDVLIGEGYDKSRQFHGLIRNITLEEGVFARNNRWGVERYASYFLVLLCTLSILSALLNRLDSNITFSTEGIGIRPIFNFSILLIGSIYFFGTLFSDTTFGIIKWIFLIAIALCYPLYEIFGLKKIKATSFNNYIFILFFILYNALLIKNNYKSLNLSNLFLIFNFLIIYFSFLTIILKKRYGIFRAALYSLIFNLVFFQLFNLASQLSNWSLLVNNYNDFPNYSNVLALISISLIIYILYSENWHSLHFKYKTGLRSITGYAINISSLVIFLIISFRHDSLFDSTISGSPIYHWEYYIGVIRSIQHGGWLLWNTPSQYGFLNIAIASIFSIDRPYQSFYLFQSTLLFITSSSLYLTISYRFSLTSSHKIFLALIIFFSIYFSDVEFIGPYPFPSSSIVRFFGAYLFITIFCLYPKFHKSQMYLVCLALPLALFWSAESAVYSLSIIIFVLTALFISLKKNNQPLIFFYKYLTFIITSSCIGLLFIIIFYKFKLGHFPDFIGFFEYAIGYASGFGYVPLNAFGPGNILLLIFIGIISLILVKPSISNSNENHNIAPISACAGCIWGISTYYIGRPVAQNITAILPLLVISLYIATSTTRNFPLSFASIAIRTIAIPIFFISLMPLWSPSWLNKTTSFKFFSSNIESSIPIGSTEIESHLVFLKSRGEKNVLIYGDGDEVTMPNPYVSQLHNFSFGIWLPTPLQLLEPPIKEERRKIYLTRYSCQHNDISGSIIRRKSNSILNDRFSSLSSDIEKFFKVEEVFNTENYTTTIYKKILPVTCSNINKS